jgi:cobalt-zinc-cadmium efflux system membrane fusion protein
VIVARAAGNVTRVNRQLGDTAAGDALAQVESMEAATMAADRSGCRCQGSTGAQEPCAEESLFKQGVTPRADLEAAEAALAVADSEAQRQRCVRAAQVAGDGSRCRWSARSAARSRRTPPRWAVSSSRKPSCSALLATALPGGSGRGIDRNQPHHCRRPSHHRHDQRYAGDGYRAFGDANRQWRQRAATVVLTPKEANAALIVGEGVQVRLHVKDGGSGLVVPEDAVQNIEGRDILFVRTKDGFRIQPVLVGARSGGVAQIMSGIKAGEQVATRNAFLVKADMIKSEKE